MIDALDYQCISLTSASKFLNFLPFHLLSVVSPGYHLIFLVILLGSTGLF